MGVGTMRQFPLSKYPVTYQLTIHFRNLQVKWTRELLGKEIESIATGITPYTVNSGNRNLLPKRIQQLFDHYGMHTVLKFYYEFIKEQKKVG